MGGIPKVLETLSYIILSIVVVVGASFHCILPMIPSCYILLFISLLLKIVSGKISSYYP
jgi:hypothetical protein